MKIAVSLFAALAAFSTMAQVMPPTFKTSHECAVALKSNPAPEIRRHAFNTWLYIEKNSDAVLKRGLVDRDPVVRRKALYEYFMKHRDRAVPELVKMSSENDFQVASLLISCVSKLKDKTLSASMLKKIADESGNSRISRLSNAKSFNFKRDNISLRDRKDWDHEIVTVKSVPMPSGGFKFAVDPDSSGHLKKYFDPAFDDSAWKKQKIGHWRKQGFDGFVGTAWYRIKFKMPLSVEHNAVELSFMAVEESAWIWLNGVYIGSHDEGWSGRDKPFRLDITKEIRWNDDNLLVVRVLATNPDGGIYKPFFVEILK